MSLFGSREEDPLLQNDPFAPDSDSDAGEAAPSHDGDAAEASASDEVSSTDAAEPPTEAAESPTTSQTEEARSVFGTTDVAPFRADESDETHIIVRSAEEAAGGHLDTLNSAFEQGWVLDRVELREASPPEGVSPSSGLPFALAFVLRRPDPK